MKKFKIATRDGCLAYVKASSHKLILKNGEKVDVIAHRPYKSNDSYWCVSEKETGFQIVGWKEYHSFICEDYFRGLDTKERALWTAVSKLNNYLCDKGKTFAEFKEKRLKEVNNV